MTKEEATELLARGRERAYADWKAKKIPATALKFGWAYIRTNRQDLIEAYVTLHPTYPPVKHLLKRRAKAAAGGR